MNEKSGKICLYAASAVPLYEQKLFDAAYRAVSEKRREKTDRLRRTEDKALSLTAELLLHQALAAQGLPELPILTGENGKPCFAGREVTFSLSHSGEYALCAISPFEVGCDLEKIAKADMEIARRFFAPGEIKMLGSAKKEEQNELFYRIWTLKESYVKMLGTGMKTPFDSFEIRFGNKTTVIVNGKTQTCGFAEFSLIPGYRCAVCGEKEPDGITFEMTDLRNILL